MSLFPNNDSWIINAGGEVIEKQAEHGKASLTDRERLIYCIWVADYGMRNAGDLEVADDLYPEFQVEAAEMAEKLSLGFIAETFSLSRSLLEEQYFDRFERICDDLRQGDQGA